MMHRRLSLISHTCRSLFFQPPNQIRTSLFFYTSSSSPADFLPSYLQTNCGFSPEKSAEATKLLSRVKSPDQPDSVITFFRSIGFDDSSLKKLLEAKPQFLARDVEKSLVPKVQTLQENGIEGTNLIDLIILSPNILYSNIQHNIVPKLEFWRRIFGSDELMMKCHKKRWCMFSNNIETLLKNDSFLQECGLSHHQISLILTKSPFIIMQKPESLNGLVSRVEKLGIPRGSSNFHWALLTLSMVSEDNLRAKVELFKGFGWSEDDFAKACRKSPLFLTTSSKVLKEKTEFLLKEGCCTASYVALNPVLLTYSLEKRLIPRVSVLKALKEKGLSDGNYKLSSTIPCNNEKFFEKYVAPYEEEVPELSQLFNASS